MKTSKALQHKGLQKTRLDRLTNRLSAESLKMAGRLSEAETKNRRKPLRDNAFQADGMPPSVLYLIISTPPQYPAEGMSRLRLRKTNPITPLRGFL